MSEEHLPSFLAVAHHDIGQEGDKWTKASCSVSWRFYSLFVLGVCMAGWEWMCEWISSECHSCAQTLERGERCLGFGELMILLFVCFRRVNGWMEMDVWVNICLYDAIRLRRLWTEEKYVWGASAKLPGRRPPRHCTARGQLNEGVIFGHF